MGVPPESREEKVIPKFLGGPNPVTILNLLRRDRKSIPLAPKYSHGHLRFWALHKEIEIPTHVYRLVLRKLLQGTSARLNPLFILMIFKPIFPTSQESI